MLKVKVEILEYISYSTRDIEGYDCCLIWDNNKAYLSLYSYRDEYVLEYLKQRGINPDDVVIEYVDKGFDYVA